MNSNKFPDKPDLALLNLVRFRTGAPAASLSLSDCPSVFLSQAGLPYDNWSAINYDPNMRQEIRRNMRKPLKMQRHVRMSGLRRGTHCVQGCAKGRACNARRFQTEPHFLVVFSSSVAKTKKIKEPCRIAQYLPNHLAQNGLGSATCIRACRHSPKFPFRCQGPTIC